MKKKGRDLCQERNLMRAGSLDPRTRRQQEDGRRHATCGGMDTVSVVVALRVDPSWAPSSSPVFYNTSHTLYVMPEEGAIGQGADWGTGKGHEEFITK